VFDHEAVTKKLKELEKTMHRLQHFVMNYLLERVFKNKSVKKSPSHWWCELNIK
jgi:hypothetical protein